MIIINEEVLLNFSQKIRSRRLSNEMIIRMVGESPIGDLQTDLLPFKYPQGRARRSRYRVWFLFSLQIVMLLSSKASQEVLGYWVEMTKTPYSLLQILYLDCVFAEVFNVQIPLTFVSLFAFSPNPTIRMVNKRERLRCSNGHCRKVYPLSSRSHWVLPGSSDLVVGKCCQNGQRLLQKR